MVFFFLTILVDSFFYTQIMNFLFTRALLISWTTVYYYMIVFFFNIIFKH